LGKFNVKLSPVHTGDYSRRKSATVAVFGDSRRSRRQSPFSATVSEFGDYSRRKRRLNSATVVASVDRASASSTLPCQLRSSLYQM